MAGAAAEGPINRFPDVERLETEGLEMLANGRRRKDLQALLERLREERAADGE